MVVGASRDEDAALKGTADECGGAARSLWAAVGILREMQDHLSLLARWFYSKPREGEIFFRGTDWPYRRLLRACARILAPTPAVPPAAPPS